MNSKTRIVVLHMKEVIYTIIFLALAIIFGILMFFMFGSKKGGESGTTDARYTPGVYTSSIQLNNNTFDVEVTVSSDKIQSVNLVNLSESTAAMFPLVEPALDSIAEQICEKQSLEDIEYADDKKYTSIMLMSSIEDALEKAENP